MSNSTAKERRDHYIKKLGGVCVKCGTTNRLQFDHIDPLTKSFRLSNGWLFSRERIEAEVAKCQLLCITCHSKKTAIDNGRELQDGEHGLSTYKNKRCRCSICRHACTEYQKEYYSRRGRLKKSAPLLATVEGRTRH